MSSNRTSLEWKLDRPTVASAVPIASNRTSLEWKPRCRGLDRECGWNTSNRTSLEWKPHTIQTLHINVYLLIEPVWNGNMLGNAASGMTDSFF